MSDPIAAWNNTVVKMIKKTGTCRFPYGKKHVIIESREDMFEAWFEGEDDEVCVAETPHQAFSDLL